MLTGPLCPEWLAPSSFPALVQLRLGNNTGLSGQLPGQLAGPANLTTLDLNNCSLSGTLPQTLPQNLKSLVLSRNEFQGVPQLMPLAAGVSIDTCISLHDDV